VSPFQPNEAEFRPREVGLSVSEGFSGAPINEFEFTCR